MRQHKNWPWLAMLISVLLVIESGMVEGQNETIKGRIDFNFPNAPEATIEVNLGKKLFSLFAKTATSAVEEPDIAELLAMVEGLYIRGYHGFQADLDGVIRHFTNQLKKDEWETIVKVKEEGNTVQVHLLFDEEVVHGIFIIASGEEDTIFLNTFGLIDFEKIGLLFGVLDDMDLDTDIKLKDLKIDRKSKPKITDQ